MGLETKTLEHNPKKLPPRIRSTHETEMQISFNDFGSLLMGKYIISYELVYKYHRSVFLNKA